MYKRQDYESKIGKKEGTAAAFWDYLKDKKSVGIINEDPSIGLIEAAHPIGVIAVSYTHLDVYKRQVSRVRS